MTYRKNVSALLFVSFLLVGCPSAGKQDKIKLPDETPLKSEKPPEPATQPSETVKIAPAEVKKSESIRVSGQISAAKQGQASFKVAGHILKHFVQVGEKVKKGQVLGTLDDSDYQLRYRLAYNATEQSKIQLNQARKDAEREEQLRKENATTAANIERQNNLMQNAQIALAQSQINLQIAQKASADTKLLSAFDGVISKRIKVEGEYVAIGNAVFEVSALGDFEVNLRVPESFIKKVKLNQVVNLSIPALNKTVSMKVARIVPIVQEQSRTFEVIGKLESESDEVVPGQFVEAVFE